MAFWGADLSAIGEDPKRKFRWKVAFGGKANMQVPSLGEGDDISVGDGTGVVWFAKTQYGKRITFDRFQTYIVIIAKSTVVNYII